MTHLRFIRHRHSLRYKTRIAHGCGYRLSFILIKNNPQPFQGQHGIHHINAVGALSHRVGKAAGCDDKRFAPQLRFHLRHDFFDQTVIAIHNTGSHSAYRIAADRFFGRQQLNTRKLRCFLEQCFSGNTDTGTNGAA